MKRLLASAVLALRDVPRDSYTLGTKLGRYQVIKHLASGGMAEVLLARASGISAVASSLAPTPLKLLAQRHDLRLDELRARHGERIRDAPQGVPAAELQLCFEKHQSLLLYSPALCTAQNSCATR